MPVRTTPIDHRGSQGENDGVVEADETPSPRPVGSAVSAPAVGKAAGTAAQRIARVNANKAGAAVTATELPPHLLAQIDRVRSVNHHLRLAIEQVGEGVIIIEGVEPSEDAEAADECPKIAFANRAAGTLTGRKAKDLIGAPLSDIYDPEALEHLVSRLPSVAGKDLTFQMQKSAVMADGEEVPFRWSIRAVRNDSGRTINFVMTLRPAEVELDELEQAPASDPGCWDADGAGQAEEERREKELKAHLEKSRIESLAQLAGGITHDFNNVLTSIFGNLSLARLASAPDGEVRKHIDDALEASQNAQSLAQQILDFTKGRDQTIKVVEMGPMVTQAAKLSTMGSQVRCDVQIDDDIWGVEADMVQIRQVIHNFLINAAQAMPDGGVVQARVKNVEVDEDHPVGDLPEGPYVSVIVRDRGCGISNENLKKIFDPYFTTKETGSGIGLATCRTIIQRHHGTIAVQSKLNVGSEFALYLPACRIEEATEPIDPSELTEASELVGGRDGETSTPDASEVIPGHGCVLVVDDQDDVRLSAQRLLEKLGYKVVSVDDGQQAVQTYRRYKQSEEPIAAVLLDMTLPGGLSGDEVMEEIRKFDSNPCVIATSGWFDEDAEERFLLDGYAGILPKPYAVESLSQKLHQAING